MSTSSSQDLTSGNFKLLKDVGAFQIIFFFLPFFLLHTVATVLSSFRQGELSFLDGGTFTAVTEVSTGIWFLCNVVAFAVLWFRMKPSSVS
jgi:TRAP-type mannitol/chloroaromatic compound transport system permease small subunit